MEIKKSKLNILILFKIFIFKILLFLDIENRKILEFCFYFGILRVFCNDWFFYMML